MRPALPASLLVLALLAGCPRREAPAEPTGPREHPLAQDGTAARAITSTPDRVKVDLDLAAVRGAIQIYRQEHELPPPSLDALGVTGLNYPADLTYDPTTGTVTSQTYPSH